MFESSGDISDLDNVHLYTAWSAEGSSKTEITRVKRYSSGVNGYYCLFDNIVVDHTLDELIADDGTIMDPLIAATGDWTE